MHTGSLRSTQPHIASTGPLEAVVLELPQEIGMGRESLRKAPDYYS